MELFVAKFSSLIVSTLSCFDRVIFKGYLPFFGDRAVHDFVDRVLNIRRKDFMGVAERHSQCLVDHSKEFAAKAGILWEYLQGSQRKDELADHIARKRRIESGPICVLCRMETCPTVKLIGGKDRPVLKPARRPQRVLYYYFADPEFGLMHVRIQTWFPFTVQVYVNGHEWLARQLLARKSGFVLTGNVFTQLDDPALAQKLSDEFVRLDWPRVLDGLARKVNPLMKEPWMRNAAYYWVSDQAEYSTDIVFKDRDALAPLYTRLLEHAALNFSARDILTFLGRKLHPRFDGEVLTDCKKDREPGARIKHRMKNNWLKMYDKLGSVLRVETVINNPKEFRVRRERTREGRPEMVWCPMNKGVSNLYRYREVALAANERYLAALSVVDNPAAAYKQMEELVEPKRVAGRSHSGFNPARSSDVALFQAVLDGNNLLQGFRNADIRRALFAEPNDAADRRRQSAATGRLLKRLHLRGLIVKVSRSRRWHVTGAGQGLLTAVVRLYHHGIPGAAKRPA